MSPIMSTMFQKIIISIMSQLRMLSRVTLHGLIVLLFLVNDATAAFRRRPTATVFDDENDVGDLEQRDLAADPRFFFANFTSSLITVNTTLLAYGLIALGLLVAAALAIYSIWVEATSRSSSSYGGSGGSYGAPAAAGYGQSYGYQQYARYWGGGGVEYRYKAAERRTGCEACSETRESETGSETRETDLLGWSENIFFIVQKRSSKLRSDI